MTQETSGAVQPGWYRDPYGGAGLRWWDGQQWAPHLRPPAPRPPAHAGHNEAIGRRTMIAQGTLSVLTTAAYGYAAARFLRDLGPYLDRLESSPAGEVPPLPGSFALLAVAAVVSVLAWIPLVLEITWSYRAATAAAALGIPAKREPIWAVLAWFIPVVSWWFPYESIRDCLPPDHPERRSAGRWWAGHLVGGSGAVAGIGAALVSTVALAAVVVLYAAIATYTALTGLRVVRAIDAEHQQRLGQAGL